MSLEEALNSGKFVVTAELEPPKGVDVSRVLDKLQFLKSVDAVNVTDNQAAVMRLSSLGLCKLILDKEIEPILQLTCRDRNRIALQSDLLSASALGIKNVLALTGDHITKGDHPEAKQVYDLDSVQLLQVAKTLQEGKDLSRKELDGTPEFFLGAAVSPCSDFVEAQVLKMEKKIDAGAQFFQTQVVYNVDAFKDFMRQIKHLNAKVIAGIIPLKSAKMATYMNENVAGITVPKDMIVEMEKAEKPAEAGLEIAVRIIKEIKTVCSGVHIMTLGREELVPQILGKI